MRYTKTPRFTVGFEGTDLRGIALDAKAWAEAQLGEGPSPADLLLAKADRLAFDTTDGLRRVLDAMLDLATAGTIPTPPLVMDKLDIKPGEEQGIRAIIGKVRTRLEAIDNTMPGPPLLESAPVVDGHTRYLFGKGAPTAIREALIRLDEMLRTAPVVSL